MTRYPHLIIALHWLLALGIIFSLLAGTFMLAETPNTDPGKMNALAIHMGLGITILTLTLVRLVTRLRKGAPDPIAGGSPMQEKAASAVHVLLYVGVIVMGASGIAMGQSVDLAGIVFFGNGNPLPQDFNDLLPHSVHELVAKGLMALILLHVAAAIYHQHVLKDGIMSRMSFRGK